MDVQLKVLIGNTAGQKIKVTGPKFFIGRSEDCNLRPRSDLISRHHCAFIVEDSYLALRDFGSKNGSLVNGERVVGERELANGDKVTIGPLEFEVCVNTGLGANKRPKVKSIKEAAARTAESGVDLNQDSGDNDMDISEWLNDDSVVDSETRELSPSETMELQLDTIPDGQPPKQPEAEAPPSGGKQRPPEKKPPGKLPTPPPAAHTEGSDAAAAEMLKKMRRFR